MFRANCGLESLPQLEVPEPTLHGGKRLVVVANEAKSRSRYKRRVFIEHILHPERNRGVIQPSAPSAWIVLGRGDSHHVFLIVVLYLDILPAIFG